MIDKCLAAPGVPGFGGFCQGIDPAGGGVEEHTVALLGCDEPKGCGEAPSAGSEWAEQDDVFGCGDPDSCFKAAISVRSKLRSVGLNMLVAHSASSLLMIQLGGDW